MVPECWYPSAFQNSVALKSIARVDTHLFDGSIIALISGLGESFMARVEYNTVRRSRSPKTGTFPLTIRFSNSGPKALGIPLLNKATPGILSELPDK